MRLHPGTLAAVMRVPYVRKLIEVVDIVLRAVAVGVPYSTALLWCRLAGVSRPQGRRRDPEDLGPQGDTKGAVDKFLAEERKRVRKSRARRRFD